MSSKAKQGAPGRIDWQLSTHCRH